MNKRQTDKGRKVERTLLTPITSGARKLACSKEPDGCSRCKREGIACHYSPQRPMGRPRKRRQVDDVPLEQAPSWMSTSQISCGYASHPELPMGLDLDFLGQEAGAGPVTGVSLLDSVPNGFFEYSGDSLRGLPMYGQTPLFNHGEQQLFCNEPFPMSCANAPLLQAVNFEAAESNPTAAPAARDAMGVCLRQYAASQLPSPPEELPPLSASSDMSSVVESPELPSGPVAKEMPGLSCGCLSSLYLAIDSLNRLPSGVGLAVRIARSACKVAEEAVSCPNCFVPLETPLKAPPVQSLQCFILLGALVPSTCSACRSILEMIEDEVSFAKKAGRMLLFSLKEVGDLWGSVADDGSLVSTIRNCNNRRLDPDLWRTAIQTLLRLDMYGPDYGRDRVTPATSSPRGLKQVLSRLEEVSGRRHELIDDLIASGHMLKPAPYLMSPAGPPGQRDCVRMLEAAKMALNSLVLA